MPLKPRQRDEWKVLTPYHDFYISHSLNIDDILKQVKPFIDNDKPLIAYQPINGFGISTLLYDNGEETIYTYSSVHMICESNSLGYH